MWISRLSLTNFRNYVSLDQEFPQHVVVIQGGNAQGKTNLLEAVYLLATTRSSRASTEKELINWLAAGEALPLARLLAQVQRSDGSLQLEIALQSQAQPEAAAVNLEMGTPSLKKRVRINGVVRRAVDVVGQVRVVMFSSPDIELIGGPPALRRRYLDLTSSQLDSRYLRHLQRYNRIDVSI